ncbi:HAD-IIIC family phosphatase [Dyella soli]|uniref:HAD-IIIC family phosphatase n=1 Tax=Dyella soli TaxID=522319 RepID=A0A4R0YS25_9GAMM|nr:HAD-IIIC family phosphatase [Dyella soli]TCI08954.1 HAD-IIIC family phosphatase [Dyella soli]
MSNSYPVEEFVRSLYKTILGREPDPNGLANWVAGLSSGAIEPHQAVRGFAQSDEAVRKRQKAASQELRIDEVASYLSPQQLRISEYLPQRILLIGSCLLETWEHQLAKYCEVDFLTVNNGMRLPANPPKEASSYDFQILQMPLRHVLPETECLPLGYGDLAEHEALFARSVERMRRSLSAMMRWNTEHRMLSFVSNFYLPQRNPMGRMFGRYDLRNPVYFIEQLNIRLYEELSAYKNAHLLDIDQIIAVFGRKYYQDDGLALTVHHGVLNNFDYPYDRQRIEPVTRATEQYQVQADQIVGALWAELLSMCRTIKQVDSVKLVIMDLDDSLWRGVAAEDALDTYGQNIVAGWPLGVIEALQYLKRRGVLLAIVSKNDEARIEELWPRIVGNRIQLSDFAVRKINWRPKAENIAEILRDVCLLPKSVVFVDDNPVERAAVKQAFPEIRTLGENPYVTRRALLWSAETQVAVVTDESDRRTQMIQAQVQRETDRKDASHEAFVEGLGIRLNLQVIDSAESKAFVRALELLNKTNQFNTTGKRWTHEQAVAFFAEGGIFYAFNVSDRYADYGLVGVVVVAERHVAQWAMSCRVLGLDVELAAMRQIGSLLAAKGVLEITGEVIETEANFLSRDLFARCGFLGANGEWKRSLDMAGWDAPSYISVEV